MGWPMCVAVLEALGGAPGDRTGTPWLSEGSGGDSAFAACSRCQAIGQPPVDMLQLVVMKPLARASVVGVVGLGLLGDPVAAQPTVDPSPRGPEESPASPRTTPGEASGTDEAATPQSAERAASSATGGASASPGGYTWGDKPATRRTSPRFRIDPERPLVQAPTFEMLADGRSRVTLAVSRNVAVERKDRGAVIVFTLPTAQVGVANNLNPLVTRHFASPLLRVQLRREKRSITLQLELGGVVPVTHAVRPGHDGGMLLVITLPAGKVRSPAESDRHRGGPVGGKERT